MEDNKQLIEQMYGSNLEAQKQQLTQNYNSAISDLDKQIQENAKTTQNNLNRTAVEADRSRKNYQEVQNAYGLSSGAMAQARLAQDNQLQADMTAIRAAQQTADQNIAREKNLIAQQYQSEIAKAQAENDMEKAQALYQLAKKDDERLLEKQKQAAASMAAAGDFSLYGQLYGLTDQQLQTLQNQYQQEQGREERELERQRQETAAEAMASIGDFSLYGQLYGLTAQQVAALEAAFRKENGTGGSGGSTSDGSSAGTTQTGSLTNAQIRELQKAVGTTVDGIWGNQSTAAAKAKYGVGSIEDAWNAYVNSGNLQNNEAILSSLRAQYPYDTVTNKRVIDNPSVWDEAAKALGGSKNLEDAGFVFRPKANNRWG